MKNKLFDCYLLILYMSIILYYSLIVLLIQKQKILDRNSYKTFCEIDHLIKFFNCISYKANNI